VPARSLRMDISCRRDCVMNIDCTAHLHDSAWDAAA